MDNSRLVFSKGTLVPRREDNQLAFPCRTSLNREVTVDVSSRSGVGSCSTNMAIADAACLGQALTENPKDLDAALRQYNDSRVPATKEEVLPGTAYSSCSLVS